MNVSFRDCLLGKPSHEALIKHQEYEIKLLDIIKRTVNARIKCEKDYAQSLFQLTQISLKIGAPSFCSDVYEAWKELVEETTQMSQYVKRNIEMLQTSTLDKLMNLIKNKTMMKKTYIENRDRIDSELIKVMHSDLDKKRSLYLKTETETANNHQTYDQSVHKKNYKQLAVERAQDKYRKSAMKLHNYHNDYVLQVEEAKMYQKHYRSSILPELLSGLQYMEVQYVDVVKEIMSEYLHFTSPCRDEVVSSHKSAEAKVNSISSSTEYLPFINSKRSDLEIEASISFEPLTSEGASLPHGQILLNSLSLQGIEHQVNSYQDDREVIREQIDHHNQHLNELDEEIRLFVQNKDSLSLLTKQQDYMSTKLEVLEKENLLLRQQQLCYLLTQSMQELGDKTPPPGLIFPEMDNLSITSTTSDKGKTTSIFNKVLNKAKVTVTSDKNSSSMLSCFDSSKNIRDQVWFHGAIPRTEATRLLTQEGSFLLREGGSASGELVLSALCQGQSRHFRLQANESGQYKFEGEGFPTVFELLQYHFKNSIPIKKNPKCVLLNPVCKDRWQLTHDDVEIHEKIGAGNFGTVFRGYMKSIDQHVAVKTCKDTVDARTKDKFLMEAKILKGYDHPNVVKLIGVCTDKHPVYIVLELVTGGDLCEFVKTRKEVLQQLHLLQLCRDACAGLAYLEEKKCIHRDVAARNCLVTEEGMVKITDFGMSREEDDGIYTVTGVMKSIPMRWTAPEAMQYGTFTSASDVWSFGILSWEIFSFGERPYPNMTNLQARDKVALGYRLPQQANCPDRYYKEVMRQCWLDDPDKRPHFSNLLRIIQSMLRSV